MGKLEGKVAVITGGNSGIGLESAKLFAKEGAKVILTGRRREAVDEAARATGHDAVGFVGDIASLDDHDRLVALAKDLFGSIDVYFANAGVFAYAAFRDTSVDMFDRTFSINVRGTYFGIQKALPRHRKLNGHAAVVARLHYDGSCPSDLCPQVHCL